MTTFVSRTEQRNTALANGFQVSEVTGPVPDSYRHYNCGGVPCETYTLDDSTFTTLYGTCGDCGALYTVAWWRR